MSSLQGVLSNYLADWQASWSMGSFGAIAEFHQDADERPLMDAPLSRVTARGAICFDYLEAVKVVAYETPSRAKHRWQQALAMCLPENQVLSHRRSTLSELGPDRQSIHPRDRSAILFDMGLAQPQLDFCIRTEDESLIALLRENEGQSLFAADNPAMAAIMKAHPHRIAVTAIGRTEVYQKIGGPDTGGKSPPGPHTHVLPKLLRSRKSHYSTLPVPSGWIPCAYLYPGNPVIDPLGADERFDKPLFDAFQNLLDRWGIAEHQQTKRAVWRALDTGKIPEQCILPATRISRAAVRVALRQAQRLRGDSGLLQQWMLIYDRKV